MLDRIITTERLLVNREYESNYTKQHRSARPGKLPQMFINSVLMNDQHLIVRDTESALLITVIMVRFLL